MHRYESSDDELDDDTSSTVLDETGQLLYDGSLLTVAASCVLIKKFALRHDLTKVAIGDLLQLIRMHCPKPNHCPTSVYRFNKQLGDLEQPSKKHYYCPHCLQELDGNEVEDCPNRLCEKDLSAVDGKNMFIEIPVEHQLQTLLESKLMLQFSAAAVS